MRRRLFSIRNKMFHKFLSVVCFTYSSMLLNLVRCIFLSPRFKFLKYSFNRCGMVYYDPGDLGWRPFVQSWMQKIGDRYKEETQVRYRSSLFD